MPKILWKYQLICSCAKYYPFLPLFSFPVYGYDNLKHNLVPYFQKICLISQTRELRTKSYELRTRFQKWKLLQLPFHLNWSIF